MNTKLKRALYESIMKSVSKTVKQSLNESNINIPSSFSFDIANIKMNAYMNYAKFLSNSMKDYDFSDNEEFIAAIHDIIGQLNENILKELTQGHVAGNSTEISEKLIHHLIKTNISFDIHNVNLINEWIPKETKQKIVNTLNISKNIALVFITSNNDSFGLLVFCLIKDLIENNGYLQLKIKQYASEF